MLITQLLFRCMIDSRVIMYEVELSAVEVMYRKYSFVPLQYCCVMVLSLVCSLPPGGYHTTVYRLPEQTYSHSQEAH